MCAKVLLLFTSLWMRSHDFPISVPHPRIYILIEINHEIQETPMHVSRPIDYFQDSSSSCLSTVVSGSVNFQVWMGWRNQYFPFFHRAGHIKSWENTVSSPDIDTLPNWHKQIWKFKCAGSAKTFLSYECFTNCVVEVDLCQSGRAFESKKLREMLRLNLGTSP